MVRPFENLSKEELLQEIRQQEQYTSSTNKKDLQQDLNKILRGIQRVPSILLTNPVQSLADFNLEQYQVLDCEPLHDIKGHISNVLTELPAVLDRNLREQCAKLIEADLSKDKKNGFDYRRTLIHLLQLLHKLHAPMQVCTLIETLVDISCLLYLREEERTLQRVLRLYNRVWLHFELLKEIIIQPKRITRRKLFGAYLHAITMHAPVQFLTMSLRSCNAEHEERLFGQAKEIATATTNRKPESIVPNILLRLQAKQKRNDLYSSLKHSSSSITKEANGVVRYSSQNTQISLTFINNHISSWQGHLQRIALFLMEGKGVWWKESDEGIEFLDGEATPAPTSTLRLGDYHFRDTTLSMVQEKMKAVWQHVIDDNSVQLPTPYIRLYDQHGQFTHLQYYQSTPQQNESPVTNTLNLNRDSEESMDTQQEPTSQTPTLPENELVDNEELVILAEPDFITSYFPQSNENIAEDNRHSTGLQTKLARAIEKQLPHKKELLMEMDKLRIRIKEKRNDRDLKRYHTIITSMKMDLLEKRNSVRSKIKDYEESHYITHNSLPASTDIHYKELLKQKKYIECLLKSQDLHIN